MGLGYEQGRHCLWEVGNLLGNGIVSADDQRLTDARAHLKNRMEDVVSKTHDHFGDPLGLLMVYVAGLEAAEKSVIISGAQIEALQLSSEHELAAHA